MKLHHDPPGQPTTPLSAKANYPLLPGESHSRWLQRTGWQRKAAATSSRDEASLWQRLYILARCGMTATKCAKSNGWAHVAHEKALCGCAPAGPPPGDSGKCQTEGTARRWSAKGEQTFADQCRRAALGRKRQFTCPPANDHSWRDLAASRSRVFQRANSQKNSRRSANKFGPRRPPRYRQWPCAPAI